MNSGCEGLLVWWCLGLEWKSWKEYAITFFLWAAVDVVCGNQLSSNDKGNDLPPNNLALEMGIELNWSLFGHYTLGRLTWNLRINTPLEVRKIIWTKLHHFQVRFVNLRGFFGMTWSQGPLVPETCCFTQEYLLEPLRRCCQEPFFERKLHEQWKKGPWLFRLYRGWNTTQSYGDFNKPI